MNLEDAKNLKKETETKIMLAIQQFEEATKCSVEEVQLSRRSLEGVWGLSEESVCYKVVVKTWLC